MNIHCLLRRHDWRCWATNAYRTAAHGTRNHRAGDFAVCQRCGKVYDDTADKWGSWTFPLPGVRWGGQ